MGGTATLTKTVKYKNIFVAVLAGYEDVIYGI
jgi:hypothetical protein